jgi:hypothetical protein
MHEPITQIPATEIALVTALVLLQEGVNGFHDTANAIAAGPRRTTDSTASP